MNVHAAIVDETKHSESIQDFLFGIRNVLFVCCFFFSFDFNVSSRLQPMQPMQSHMFAARNFILNYATLYTNEAA